MAELKPIRLGDTFLERTEDINENFSELEQRKLDKNEHGFATLDADGKVNQTAKTADQAKDFDTTGGTINTELNNLAEDISEILDGTVVVAKAKALDPTAAPGNLKYYGTDEFGNIGWHDYVGGSEDPTAMTAVVFTSSTGWTASGDYQILTLPHNNKYPVGVFKEVSEEHLKVVVGEKRTSSNVVITSHTPFSGYLLLG